MEELLKKSYLWAKSYIRKFYTENSAIQPMILLKEDHTNYVVDNCKALAKALKMNAHDCILAELIGLFHDIGRFKQYSVYQTFNDRLSEDHALLGLNEIKDLALLQALTAEDLAVFQFAIANHNAKVIAPSANARAILFAKLIRDADKLDIYRVLSPRLQPSDGSGYNQDFMQLFLQGKQCDYTLIKTQDDQKLVRLLWLYDIYFPWTMQRIIERGYLEEIAACLPQDDTTRQGVALLQKHVQSVAKRNDFV